MARRKTLLILASVVALGTPATLVSQLAAANAGSRVRVKAPTVQKALIVGQLTAPIGDSAVIAVATDSTGARRLAIATTSIETLEVSLGRKSAAGRAQGVRIGALLAVGLGVAAGIAFYGSPPLMEGGSNAKGAGIGASFGFGVFTTALTILPLMGAGVVVGSIVKKEQWQRVYPAVH